MSADWAELESHLVNGAFPLQRCVGSTDHSGVFLTQSTPHAPSAAALKLITFDPGSAETQLSRWRAAIELSHPNLVRIFEAGPCRVDGADYLFARMEYADQTLAQVLQGRALTEDEAREMLVPTLDALDYLHQRNLVHGGLKPSNLLVVGDRLKLASDTVRELDPAGDDATAAADVHALGLTLCEALTRRLPSGRDRAGEVQLPPGLPASFSGIVAHCLSRDPRHRPTVAQLQAWLRGETPPTAEPPAPAKESPTRLVIRVELPGDEVARRAAAASEPTSSWRVGPLIIAAVVLVALGWAGYRAIASRSSSSSPPVGEAAREAPPRVEAPPAATAPAPATAATAPAAPATPAAQAPTPPTRAEPPLAAPSSAAVDEVLPVVSQSSLDTIRGTVRVSVRVSIDANGRVTAATPDDPGPSRYFERRSLDAARKWTFAPSTEAQRSMQLRFAFTRSGVTATARPIP